MSVGNFTFRIRVYYEDTDAGGVVYYANYLRFFERARSEWLRELGFEQNALMQTAGIAFIARSVQIEYLKPGRLDDELCIVSTIAKLGRAQIVFSQRVERNSELLVDGMIRVASFDLTNSKAIAMPKEIHEKLKALMGTSV